MRLCANELANALTLLFKSFSPSLRTLQYFTEHSTPLTPEHGLGGVGVQVQCHCGLLLLLLVLPLLPLLSFFFLIFWLLAVWIKLSVKVKSHKK